MTETPRKARNVYQVSDAIKECFKDEEGLLPVVDVQLVDRGRITWKFRAYSLDHTDLRKLVELTDKFYVTVSVVANLKEHCLDITLRGDAEVIQCDGQKFGLSSKGVS